MSERSQGSGDKSNREESEKGDTRNRRGAETVTMSWGGTGDKSDKDKGR